MNNKQRYQLRHAAGMYWLLDMQQPGVPYKKPIAINEMGAQIWNLMQEDKENEAIAKTLSASYGVSPEMILEDVMSFQKQLADAGVVR
ncbi:MAG: PqqD family protein [Lachnospiraceae bacterium]|nr:PqqD family protein [Lachnospiraceae bacterium]